MRNVVIKQLQEELKLRACALILGDSPLMPLEVSKKPEDGKFFGHWSAG